MDKYINDKNVIMLTLFGSDLYGTNTPASDKDYKGIAIPTWEDLCLNRISKTYEQVSTGGDDSKNTSDDIDIEIISLHEFFNLSIQGQTMAMDMLHAPENMLLKNSVIWQEIQKNKEIFYSTSIESFIGYARTQASKYGIKGSRLDDAKSVLDWLNTHEDYEKLLDCDLSTFPKGEHIIYIPENGNDIKTAMFEVCNRKFQVTCKISYAKDIVQRFYDAYGERAKLASENKGIDWKAISHAFRAAYQCKELFLEGNITFPLKEAEFLKKIKLGEMNYNDISPILEDLICEVKDLSLVSKLPDKIDKDKVDNFLMSLIEQFVVPK